MVLQSLSAYERPHGRLGGRLPSFLTVPDLDRLKSCSPSASVSVVGFSIANTD